MVMMSRKASIAILALALAIVPTHAQANWPASGCAGDGPSPQEYTVGTYTEATSAELMVNALFAKPLAEGLVTVVSQTLYGASSQGGIVRYCQGFIYDGLLATETQDLTAVVFTTGNGQLPHITPIPTANGNGNPDDNIAGNDRYTVVTFTPNITLPGKQPVCINTGGTQAIEYEGSGISATLTAEKTGTITFNFAFASDEYPEYVTRQYKDQMRFLYRVRDNPYQNVALINGDNVGIDTVNEFTNSGQYIDNDSENINPAGYTAFPTQYDGLTNIIQTTPMTFKKGDTVDVAIFVVDCNDRQLDSAIIIQPGVAVIDEPPVCSPLGQGVTIVPSPSAVAGEITITFDVEDTNIKSGVCTTPSGVDLPCSGFVPIEGTAAFRCTITYTTVQADYVDDGVVSCVATDTADQEVRCSAELLLNKPPSCYAEGEAVILSPSPSVPGVIDITFTVADDDLVEMKCTAPSGTFATCNTFLPVAGSDPAAVQCTFPLTTASADYVAGGQVTCVATDSAGQETSCSADLLLNEPPSCYPNGQGVIIDPSPSSVGDTISIFFTVADADVASGSCTTHSGATLTCASFVPLPNSSPAAVQCSLSYVTVAGDYDGAVTCTAEDSAGQPVICSAALLQLVPSPAPPPASPAVPSPSPKPAPSPAKPVPLPSPKPAPSPAVPVPVPSPSPTAPPPDCIDPVVPDAEIPPGADPNNAQCWILSGDSTIDYSANKSCSNCQWQCLTNIACTGIAIYSSDNVVSREDLASWNCGNGAWNNGAMLCVLVGQEGNVVYPDTQEQGCNECRHQCQFWAECTGVYYQYTFYDKVGLYQTMCC